jgi:hypothetical protein
MSTKKRKVGAKRMWAYTGEGETDGMMFWDASNPHYQAPHFVLPATKEDYEAMVEQGARAICDAARMTKDSWYDSMHDSVREGFRREARAVLASLNINPPKK